MGRSASGWRGRSSRSLPTGALLIGTDTPSLPAALLAASLDALRRHRVVIAPSLDGGYYAVGVRGAMPPIFTAIRWGTGSVFASTVERLKRAGIRTRSAPRGTTSIDGADVMLLGRPSATARASAPALAMSRDRVRPRTAWSPAPRSLKYPDARMGALQFMIELILYTRNDCELCREMEEVIAAELPKFDARIQRIEIDGDAGLEARFGIEVPVLFVNDRKAFKYRCTRGELRKRLAREGQSLRCRRERPIACA